MPSPTPFIELLRDRRSIRQFQPQPLTASNRAQLREALLRAPTSRGKNPWHFIEVTDRSLLEQLSRAKQHGSSFLVGAALAIVICADETVSDVWIEDCAIAAITLQYAAHALGLGSCWAQMRNRPHDANGSAEDYLRQLLAIPQQQRVLCIIGIGAPAEEKAGHPEAELPANRFRQVDSPAR